ncbi:type II toxin-antitoxin system RelE/ParE family toxin [Woodsholea maritima]|uniref:type II toxin-antitoxin system RelE/ParE family toxin n=1 Tax=Woodsholea maritima TaxID=240237 RepID=UPI00036F9855|nr:type II toxin-antitoxin system RelE/ParE family toxin [Woodsholea maritima]
MTPLWVTRAAEDDLRQIVRWGQDHFGPQQSKIFRDKLDQVFRRIAHSPTIYPQVDYIRPGYRRALCGPYSIYYRLCPDGIEIIRVLGRQHRETTL